MKNFIVHSIDDTSSLFSVSLKRAAFIIENGTNCLFTFDDGYQSIYGFLVSVDPRFYRKIRIFLVAEKIGGINDWDVSGDLAGKPLLSWEQVRELKRLGVKFGSHSLTHADLTRLSERELERETRESKRILEEILNEPVEGFAYPFGFFDERVVSAVKNAGYRWAVTTSDSVWEGWRNPYRIRRINISGLDPDWLLRAKLNGFYDIKALWGFPKLLWEKAGLFFGRARRGRSIQ